MMFYMSPIENNPKKIISNPTPPSFTPKTKIKIKIQYFLGCMFNPLIDYMKLLLLKLFVTYFLYPNYELGIFRDII